MSELRELRAAIAALGSEPETAGLGDEEWYDRLWELLDPVIDARAERSLAAIPTHDAGEYRDPETGQPASAEAPSTRGEMTFAQAEAILVEYQREKLTRQQDAWRREQR